MGLTPSDQGTDSQDMEVRSALSKGLPQRFVRAQSWLLVLYAVSLPISLTASWVILCLGLAALTLELVFRVRTKPAAGAQPAKPAGSAMEPPGRLFRQKPPLAIPLIVLAAAVTLSGFVNGGLPLAMNCFISLRAMLVYFWAFRVFSADRSVLFLSVQALLITGAAAGCAGMFEQLADVHLGYRYLQGTGFLGGPMAYAGQMQILSLLSLGLLLTDGYQSFRFGLSRKAVFLALVLANMLGVLFASERSAWLGAIAGFLALAAVLSWRALLKSCLVLALVSAIAWTAIPVVQTRLSPLAHWQQDVSTRVRINLWRESIRLWQRSPFFGVGITRFPHFVIPEAIVPGRSKDLNHAHSNYLHILATSGVLGLIAYLWLLWAALRAGLRQGRLPGSPAESGLALGIFAGTVGLMVSGIFEYNFGTAQVRLAQWFVLSMLVD